MDIVARDSCYVFWLRYVITVRVVFYHSKVVKKLEFLCFVTILSAFHFQKSKEKLPVLNKLNK